DVNHVVTERASEVGLSHEDGKIECVYFEGDILVADVVGTFDENRFLFDGQQISKEFLRQFYKGYDPEWVSAVDDAKKEADDRDIADWK
ncbi:MAG: phosphoribosylaminoimidazolesuccinocarboxamide synthase, partial [Halobacteria archaeon]|nr:phosphoribosylaminoimidazolesuccinocarboxamide synthase [Halobacteria archaeon]